ncbi:hypothetical protein DSAG12_02166 [Promethearchaeum syntrophicum]|uniref:Uncharacterized protein n=1 Tax=Promethearchaeum syntrophicum TaxID=2594042 RepID=A0A5B9DCB5_9ARCH|nr:hypothetical protein [Candidatus Prometheoarchaeum syntrophicum]QEE16336.1 hypothetical protein DSAG12_02166 [Candidatus Prometheoarchaeum syntrophicum]
MSSQNANYVVKMNTALSNKPFFVKITDPNISISRNFSEAIFVLRNTGRPLESDQFHQLFEHHQIFYSGKTVQKGEFFRDLSTISQNINEQNMTLVELDLVSSHSGGKNK